MVIFPLGLHIPTHIQNRITQGNALNPINVLMATGEITKMDTLTTTLHKPAWEANLYSRFVYGPLTIF